MAIGEAKLFFDNEVLVTCIAGPNVSGNQATWISPGQLRFWDAISGEPLSKIVSFDFYPVSLKHLDTDSFKISYINFASQKLEFRKPTVPARISVRARKRTLRLQRVPA